MKTWYFKIYSDLKCTSNMECGYSNVEYIAYDAETINEAINAVQNIALDKYGEPVPGNSICHNASSKDLSWYVQPISKYYFEREQKIKYT